MQQRTKWIIDPSHTKVAFSARHFGISETDGFFRNYTAEVNTEKEDFSDLQVQVTVNIDTNDLQRDAYLKADDFFHAAQFPEMKFESTKMETTEIENETKAGFRMSGSINRQNYGLSFHVLHGTGNLAVSDKVKINIPFQLLKVPQTVR